MPSNKQITRSQRKLITGTISCVLNRLQRRTELTTEEAVKIPMFVSLQKSTVTVRQYMKRMTQFSQASLAPYVQALIYVDRMVYTQPDLVFHELTFHRIFLASMVCAIKFIEDFRLSNQRYATIGGIPLTELNQLELCFAMKMNFDFYISPETFKSYYGMLEDYGHQNCGCKSSFGDVNLPLEVFNRIECKKYRSRLRPKPTRFIMDLSDFLADLTISSPKENSRPSSAEDRSPRSGNEHSPRDNVNRKQEQEPSGSLAQYGKTSQMPTQAAIAAHKKKTQLAALQLIVSEPKEPNGLDMPLPDQPNQPHGLNMPLPNQPLPSDTSSQQQQTISRNFRDFRDFSYGNSSSRDSSGYSSSNTSSTFSSSTFSSQFSSMAYSSIINSTVSSSSSSANPSDFSVSSDRHTSNTGKQWESKSEEKNSLDLESLEEEEEKVSRASRRKRKKNSGKRTVAVIKKFLKRTFLRSR